MNKLELDAMADIQADGGGDVDVCKSFLWQKNNDGELNIDKLVLVGDEMGATAAVNWAALDWSFEPVANIKQGKFAKAADSALAPKSLQRRDDQSLCW